MVRITEDLIRKKAEHHDDVLATLEEITLHQLEIEKIEIIGNVCRNLRILYLQNNIISKLEGLYHLKELRYLNMALNNITKMEGLQSCEFLSKLDFTVNFIDMDELENSYQHLQPLLHLKELYMMGNPVTLWEHFRPYTIVMLPQLQLLDGAEITKTERITSLQIFRKIQNELRTLANEKRIEKGLPQVQYQPVDENDENEPWTPEARIRMYREMAEQKAEQEKSRKALEPQERNYEKEQNETVEKVRQHESEGHIRQTNEGRWEFTMEEEDGEGNCILRISLSRFLDTSLIDVDVHPTYVSVIIKGRVFRILWPEEVKASEGKCQRSQTSGELMIKVPKVNYSKVLADLRKKEKEEEENNAGKRNIKNNNTFGKTRNTDTGKVSSSSSSSSASTSSKSSTKLMDTIVQEASKAVNLNTMLLSKNNTNDNNSHSTTVNGNASSSSSSVLPRTGSINGVDKDHIGDGTGGQSLFKPTTTTNYSKSKSSSSTTTTTTVTVSSSSTTGTSNVNNNSYYDNDVDESEVPPLE